MTTDKKRAQTSYGSVEYDTLPCAECTNETVTSEITHLYVFDDQFDGTQIESESIAIHPVCYGCIEDTYGGDGGTDVLDHDTLCQFYADQKGSMGAKLVTANPETIETSAATIHGTVDVSVADCSRCEGEWTVDDLRAAHVPLAIVNGELHTGTRLYCPDCRELYITAIGSEGANFQEVVESEGDVLSDAGESKDDELTALQQALVIFAGSSLVGIILAAIHPLIAGLFILYCWAVVAYLLYRHFTGRGPVL